MWLGYYKCWKTGHYLFSRLNLEKKQLFSDYNKNLKDYNRRYIRVENVNFSQKNIKPWINMIDYYLKTICNFYFCFACKEDYLNY